jgi:hypothetical protein
MVSTRVSSSSGPGLVSGGLVRVATAVLVRAVSGEFASRVATAMSCGNRRNVASAARCWADSAREVPRSGTTTFLRVRDRQAVYPRFVDDFDRVAEAVGGG